MQVVQTGFIALVLAAVGIGGGGYVMSGSRDFTVEIGRPLPEVYETFSSIKTFGSGLRDEGFDVPETVVTRPSDHELVFTSPAADPTRSSRIAFTFEPGANSATTKVTAAIDVPPVQAYIDGERKELSEDKVEGQFREAIGDMAKQMNQGNSTSVPAHKLKLLLDVVAIASHPGEFEKMRARVEKLKAAETRINDQLRAEWKEKRDRYEQEMKREDSDFRFGQPTMPLK